MLDIAQYRSFTFSSQGSARKAHWFVFKLDYDKPWW